MRILTIAESTGALGGRERAQLEIFQDLAAQGNEVVLLRREIGALEARWSAIAHVVTIPDALSLRVNRRNALRDFSGLTRLALAQRRPAPDVVYVHARQHMVAGAAVSTASRCALVAHLHDPAWVAGRQDRWAFGRTDRFIAVSRSQADDWIETGIAPDRTVVIRNGVDLAHFSPHPVGLDPNWPRSNDLPADRPLIGFIGRIVPDKGLHVLVEASAHLAQRGSRICVVVAGETDRDVCTRDYCQDLGLFSNADVRVVGPQVDPRDFYHAMDLVVLPSVYPDPFPLTTLEAMACGTPVVTSRVGGLPEALLPEFGDQLAAVGDARDLADVLERVLFWRREQPTLGTRSRRHVEEYFDARDVFARITAEIEAVVERRSRR